MIRALLLTLSICTAGDSATTHYGLSLGGREANPMGPYAVDVVHGAMITVGWTFIRHPKPEERKFVAGALGVAAGLECLWTAHTIQQIQLQQQYNRGIR